MSNDAYEAYNKAYDEAKYLVTGMLKSCGYHYDGRGNRKVSVEERDNVLDAVLHDVYEDGDYFGYDGSLMDVREYMEDQTFLADTGATLEKVKPIPIEA